MNWVGLDYLEGKCREVLENVKDLRDGSYDKLPRSGIINVFQILTADLFAAIDFFGQHNGFDLDEHRARWRKKWETLNKLKEESKL